MAVGIGVAGEDGRVERARAAAVVGGGAPVGGVGVVGETCGVDQHKARAGAVGSDRPGRDIVVDQHLLDADKGRPSDLVGIKPAALDGCKTFVTKIDGHIGDILNTFVDVCLSLTIHIKGIGARYKEDD